MDRIPVGSSALRRINVDRDEEFGICFVCNGRAVCKLDEFVGAPGQDDLYFRVSVPDERSKAFGDGKGEGFFVRFAVTADRSCIFSAVSCIYYNGVQAKVIRPDAPTAEKQSQEYADCVFQKLILLLYFANIEINCK